MEEEDLGKNDEEEEELALFTKDGVDKLADDITLSNKKRSI